MDRQIISALQKSKLLKDIDVSELNLEKVSGKLHTVKGGEVLYREGDKADSVYVLINGEINLIDDKNKKSNIIYSDNDFFGTEELFENVDRYTTTVSLTESSLIELSKEEIEFLISQNKKIKENIQKSNSQQKPEDKRVAEKSKNLLDDFELSDESFDDAIWNNSIDDIISSIEEQEEAILNNITEFDDDALEDFELEAELTDEINEESLKDFINNEKHLKEDDTKAKNITDEKEFFINSEQFSLIVKSLQLINANVRTEDVLKNIVDVAINLTNADRGTLYLVDREQNEIWSKVLVADEVEEIRLKMGEGIAGWVALNGGTLNIENVKEDERFQPSIDEITGYETKNMLCYPIKNKREEIVAVLQLLNSIKGKFTYQEEMYLDAISLNIAAVLENSALVEKLLEAERTMSLDKMGNFLGHDIKKPILTSKRYAEHLSKKELPFDVKQIVDMLVEQLNYVADKISTTSEYTEGTIILRRQNVSLNDTLHKYAAEANPLLSAHNCKIEYELDQDVNVFVDIKEFYQCYHHIVKNSCEAMLNGGNVFISTKVNGNKVAIVFEDNGTGIDSNDLKHVFEPFFTKNKTKNSGLGLSISKKIIEDHEGTIKIESEKNKGTTVTIELPIH